MTRRHDDADDTGAKLRARDAHDDRELCRKAFWIAISTAAFVVAQNVYSFAAARGTALPNPAAVFSRQSGTESPSASPAEPFPQ